jgi:hypothetical protein
MSIRRRGGGRSARSLVPVSESNVNRELERITKEISKRVDSKQREERERQEAQRKRQAQAEHQRRLNASAPPAKGGAEDSVSHRPNQGRADGDDDEGTRAQGGSGEPAPPTLIPRPPTEGALNIVRGGGESSTVRGAGRPVPSRGVNLGTREGVALIDKYIEGLFSDLKFLILGPQKAKPPNHPLKGSRNNRTRAGKLISF